MWNVFLFSYFFQVKEKFRTMENSILHDLCQHMAIPCKYTGTIYLFFFFVFL